MWACGSWSALAVAVGSAALVNLALLSSFVWSELFPPQARTALWTAVLAIWGSSAVLCYSWDRRGKAAYGTSAAAERSLEVALGYYLQGSWFEAERELAAILQRNPRDLEARLMVATLLRHTGRLDEAGRQLDQLERLEDSRKWELEIRRERELLAEKQAERAEQDSEAADEAVASNPDAESEAVGKAA
jgi:uncharacterized protein HemY